MRAKRRSAAGPRLCGLALLLACALGLGAGAAGRVAAGHKHLVRGVAAVAITADDHPTGGHRVEVAADTTARTPVTALARWGRGTADSSAPVSSTTAQSPPVRGPPAEAAG